MLEIAGYNVTKIKQDLLYESRNIIITCNIRKIILSVYYNLTKNKTFQSVKDVEHLVSFIYIELSMNSDDTNRRSIIITIEQRDIVLRKNNRRQEED
jgi:hypothetical protein